MPNPNRVSHRAARATQAAHRLEIMGRNGDLARARIAIDDLESKVILLRDSMTRYVEDHAVCAS